MTTVVEDGAGWLPQATSDAADDLQLPLSSPGLLIRGRRVGPARNAGGRLARPGPRE